MKKMRLFGLLLAMIFVMAALAGCSQSMDKGDPEENNATVGNGIYENGSDSGSAPEVPNRKLIRTISMNAETEDLDTLLEQLDSQVKELGGYVESRDVRNGSSASSGNRSARLTLRIPSAQLDNFVNHVSGATNVISSSENTEDVTLNYVATQSRITALETEEARLLELLTQAENLNDLLLIESRLTQVRTELEKVKSQLKLYDNLVDYGTMHLSIQEVKEYTVIEEDPTAWERISTGFVKSVKGLGTILSELFIFLIIALPYLVIPAAVIVTVLLVKRHKKRKANSTPPENQP